MIQNIRISFLIIPLLVKPRTSQNLEIGFFVLEIFIPGIRDFNLRDSEFSVFSRFARNPRDSGFFILGMSRGFFPWDCISRQKATSSYEGRNYEY